MANIKSFSVAFMDEHVVVEFETVSGNARLLYAPDPDGDQWMFYGDDPTQKEALKRVAAAAIAAAIHEAVGD